MVPEVRQEVALVQMVQMALVLILAAAAEWGVLA